MSELEGAKEYRDAWRGLQLMVPAGWQVRRSGMGLILHDRSGQRAVMAQPRPRASSVDSLERDLLAWLRRFDPQAELHAEPDDPAQTRVCNAFSQLGPGQEIIGVFALQMRPEGGFISGYLAPVASYEADSRAAVQILATLQPAPALSRNVWREAPENSTLAVLPRGWHAEGQLNRNNPGGVAAASLRAWADESTRVMASAEGKLYVEPGLLSGILGGLAAGMVGQGKFTDAAGYAEAHLLPALRREAADARFEAITPRPDILPLVAAQQAVSGGLAVKDILLGQPSGADVLATFHRDGRELRQLSRVVTMRVPAPMSRGLPLWMAVTPFSYQAEVARFAELEPVLEGVGLSFHINPEWRQAERARLPRQLKGRLPEERPMSDMAGLYEEAERLMGEQSGQQLALHERPFAPPDGEEPDGDERAQAVPGLCAESIWQDVHV